MIAVITALLVLLLVAFGLWAMVRTQRQLVTNLDELAGHTRPVDMVAFQNLLDRAETQFLRQSLPPMEFRLVQRERTLAAIEYVRCIAHNAGVLIQIGQFARENPDPQLSEAARIMVERAAHVRLIAAMVLIKLYVNSALPMLPFNPEDIFRDYRHLTESAVLFTRLQRPAFAGRVSAML